MIYRELLLGAGSRREKLLAVSPDVKEWKNLTTLDIIAAHGVDVVHDLNVKPWPFADNTFDELHAYEVMEHLGQQGDYQAFFSDFYEAWRILKPGGRFYGTTPGNNALWTWGDPGHTRVICGETLTYLSQDQYKKQIGITSMTDYRPFWKGDFDISLQEVLGESCFAFCLRAIK